MTISPFYWRTQAGKEVDFILERGKEIVGVEVKWTARIQEKDPSGLKAARDFLANRWRFGVLVHSGNEFIPIDEKTIAVPFSVFLGRE